MIFSIMFVTGCWKMECIFCDGETLSFTSDEHLTITKSKAIYVNGDSFKINF